MKSITTVAILALMAGATPAFALDSPLSKPATSDPVAGAEAEFNAEADADVEAGANTGAGTGADADADLEADVDADVQAGAGTGAGTGTSGTESPSSEEEGTFGAGDQETEATPDGAYSTDLENEDSSDD